MNYDQRHDAQDMSNPQIIISARVSSIMHADKIIVLRKGKILESGTHKELLAQKGYYFELYKNQMSDEAISKLLKS